MDLPLRTVETYQSRDQIDKSPAIISFYNTFMRVRDSREVMRHALYLTQDSQMLPALWLVLK
jgi:hypothetical protein